MPKKCLKPIQLPVDKPDCCVQCPLLGIIPKELRKKGSKETHICCGTMHAISGRGTKVKASNRDSHHPLKRPCDDIWETWMRLQNRKLGIPSDRYNIFRAPYENSLEMKIIFHS